MDQSAPETPIVPADTTMYLSVPEMRIHNVPVVECASEASLTGGVGHLLGSGCPWVVVSNTYIAGHRLDTREPPANTSSTIYRTSSRETKSCPPNPTAQPTATRSARSWR